MCMICDSLYHALINSVLVVCINTTKSNVLICSNYALFENSIIEGNIVRMVFLNLYTKCCCILFKWIFFLDGFICCGAFTEVYIGPFRKMVNKYFGNVIFSTCLIQFDRLKCTFLFDHVHLQYPLLTHFY